jgi:hypothetical protein
MDKEGVRPGTPQGQEPGKPEPVDRSAERIAVAIEHIERTLERRPVGSGRNAALVELLGEAPRVAPPRPTAPGSDRPGRPRREPPRTS